jgi:hypothetical protein
MDTKGDADFFLFIELDLRALSPTFYLLTNAQARETYKASIRGGNCAPPHVSRLATANDFSALNSGGHRPTLSTWRMSKSAGARM